MALIPRSLARLIDELGRLPGVGPRSAERYALSILKSDKPTANALAEALATLHDGVKTCPKTFSLIEPDQDISPLYDDPERDKKLIMVVENPLDVIAMEKMGDYRGTYHVIGGLLSPIDNIGPEQLRLRELVDRVLQDKAEEVVLATNAGAEGESTALYIQKLLADFPIKLSRLARGIPVGVDLEYTDQLTLSRALEHRQLM